MPRGGCWLRVTEYPLAAVDAAVVLTVSVAVIAAAPTIAGGAVTEHVGAPAPPFGPPVTEQLRATLPVKPPLELIVMVDVALGPGDAMVTAVLLSVKPGGTASSSGEIRLSNFSRLPLLHRVLKKVINASFSWGLNSLKRLAGSRASPS